MENYCIDLDGSLIKTDLFLESLWKFIKLNPIHFIQVLWWLRRGRSYLKFRLAQIVSIEAETLPYDQDILNWLRDLKNRGNNLYLVTGSTEKWAQKVAEHLKIFNMVMASSPEKNLVNKNKQKALEESFGKENFYYMGNSRADFSVFSSAKEAITVGTSQFRKKVETIRPIHRHFDRKIFSWGHFFQAIRVDHWAKNLIIFFPLIFSQDWANIKIVETACLAFFSFSFLASSVYLLNDLLDLETDRENLLKKKRPFASGNMSLIIALISIPLFIGFSVFISLFLSYAFFLTLVTYFFTTTIYSFYLKRMVGLDILSLTALYILRLLAGNTATNIPPSPWPYLFCSFFFMGWAMMKRYTEVRDLRYQNTKKVEGRGYQVQDEGVILNTGIIFSLISLLVMVLILKNENFSQEYKTPEILWLTIPLIFYWNFRMWILASRGIIKTAPIIFSLKDQETRIIIFLMILIFILARFVSFNDL